MISLDQVLLLQEKVETAVEKISALGNINKQLKAENDALRQRVAELSKALSDKSELVSTLESDQDKIEQSILDALNRLDTVENSILSGSAGTPLPSSDSMEEKPIPSEKKQVERIRQTSAMASAVAIEESVHVPEFARAKEPVIDIPVTQTKTAEKEVLNSGIDIF